MNVASSPNPASTASETYQVVRDIGTESSMTAHASGGAQSFSVMLESHRDWQRLGQNVDKKDLEKGTLSRPASFTSNPQPSPLRDE